MARTWPSTWPSTVTSPPIALTLPRTTSSRSTWMSDPTRMMSPDLTTCGVSGVAGVAVDSGGSDTAAGAGTARTRWRGTVAALSAGTVGERSVSPPAPRPGGSAASSRWIRAFRVAEASRRCRRGGRGGGGGGTPPLGPPAHRGGFDRAARGLGAEAVRGGLDVDVAARRLEAQRVGGALDRDVAAGGADRERTARAFHRDVAARGAQPPARDVHGAQVAAGGRGLERAARAAHGDVAAAALEGLGTGVVLARQIAARGAQPQRQRARHLDLDPHLGPRELDTRDQVPEADANVGARGVADRDHEAAFDAVGRHLDLARGLGGAPPVQAVHDLERHQMDPAVGARAHLDRAARILDLEQGPAGGIENLVALLPQRICSGA